LEVCVAKKNLLFHLKSQAGLLTHAGCHICLAKHKTDVEKIAAHLNKKFAEWLASPTVNPDGFFVIG